MGLFYTRAADGTGTPSPSGWRVAVATMVLVLLLGGALITASSPEYAQASLTLLRSFEVALAAFLALLGIETAKRG